MSDDDSASKRKRYLGYYILSVIAASIFLVVKRWDSVEGFWGYMDLISLSIWQSLVWPLYLLMHLAGGK